MSERILILTLPTFFSLLSSLDAAQQHPWVMVMTFLSFIYFLAVRLGGEDFNVSQINEVDR